MMPSIYDGWRTPKLWHQESWWEFEASRKLYCLRSCQDWQWAPLTVRYYFTEQNKIGAHYVCSECGKQR